MLADPDLSAKVQAADALDLVEKPLSAAAEAAAENLVKTLRALAKVRVIRYWGRKGATMLPFAEYPGLYSRPEIVLIVASTGGPQALQVILRNLPADFPLPIVIVQHQDGQFLESMLHWLGSLTPLPLKLALPGERPQPGYVYLAPPGTHLRLSYDGRFLSDPETAGYLHVPSGDILLTSVAEVYGANAIGVILTGMGNDGAAGLLRMRQQRARTIAQDEKSSVVFGMPKEAIAIGAVEFIEPLENIARALVRLANEGRDDRTV
ncbi:MAG: chemotaxis protein CheB [Anaerolineae bacterium]|nr:chemotaxis protein CheB [Anaerolineae bacterium]